MTPDATLLHGDCLEMLRGLPDNNVDAVVTDPPAGIAFMGKEWDDFGTKRKSASESPSRKRYQERRADGKGNTPSFFTYDNSTRITDSRAARDAFIAFMTEVMRECRRVMKPGAHALVWALPRTSHWTGMALEDAGLEVRDSVHHVYGSGFPKSMDVSKQLDKMAGATRKVVGVKPGHESLIGEASHVLSGGWERPWMHDPEAVARYHSLTAPATDAAREWDGWGTALKPSHEVWWLCRKPLAAGTVAANVLAYGTGALNITACRAGDEVTITQVKDFTAIHGNKWGTPRASTPTLEYKENPPGRWPPNVLLSHSLFCAPDACSPDCPVRVLGEQSGVRTTSKGVIKASAGKQGYHGNPNAFTTRGYGDLGTAARFFPNFPADPADAVPFLYTAKASRSERNQGCDGLPVRDTQRYGVMTGTPEHGAKHDTPERNSHPTVKSLALMSWLVRLITPPGGVVLDPFMGSGSTGVACMREGFDFIGIEREYDYWQIASARTAHAQFAVAEQPDPPPMPKQRRHSPSIPRASGNGGKVSQDSLLHGCG